MNWLKSPQAILTASLILVAVSFLIANGGSSLAVEETVGAYHAVHSCVPWLLQWGAIALFLGYLSKKWPQQQEWLSPRIVLPWFGVGFVWWIVALSALWNVTILDLLNERVLSYASETLVGTMSPLDWLLCCGWLVNPIQASVPFSLVGWGGVTGFIHSVTATAVFCGLGYILAQRSRDSGLDEPSCEEVV